MRVICEGRWYNCANLAKLRLPFPTSQQFFSYLAAKVGAPLRRS